MDDPVPAAAPGMFLQDGAVSEARKLYGFGILLRALEKTANSLRSDSAVFSSNAKFHSLRVCRPPANAPSWRNIPDTAAGTGSGIGKNVMLKTLLYGFEN